jgi:hypothetical protein
MQEHKNSKIKIAMDYLLESTSWQVLKLILGKTRHSKLEQGAIKNIL